MNPCLRDWLRATPKTDNSVPIQEHTFYSAAALARILGQARTEDCNCSDRQSSACFILCRARQVPCLLASESLSRGLTIPASSSPQRAHISSCASAAAASSAPGTISRRAKQPRSKSKARSMPSSPLSSRRSRRRQGGRQQQLRRQQEAIPQAGRDRRRQHHASDHSYQDCHAGRAVRSHSAAAAHSQLLRGHGLVKILQRTINLSITCCPAPNDEQTCSQSHLMCKTCSQMVFCFRCNDT